MSHTISKNTPISSYRFSSSQSKLLSPTTVWITILHSWNCHRSFTLYFHHSRNPISNGFQIDLKPSFKRFLLRIQTNLSLNRSSPLSRTDFSTIISSFSSALLSRWLSPICSGILWNKLKNTNLAKPHLTIYSFVVVHFRFCCCCRWLWNSITSKISTRFLWRLVCHHCCCVQEAALNNLNQNQRNFKRSDF